jgi:hypothetical protein
MAVRVLIEGYKAYRVWYFLDEHYFHIKEVLDTYTSCMIIIVTTCIMDEIVLVLLIISTFKCLGNFGKGFKEILVKQIKANEVTTAVEATDI